MRNCKNCGSRMGMGAPHSEEIKIQYECRCGNIETENYSPEETAENERLANGESEK